MSNANRDYAIVYDIKNSSLVLSRPLIFYLTDKNTSNIFVKLVTRVIVGDGIDQYTDIENASNYVLTMRVIKPNNEVKSLEATQHEPENIFQFDLTEDFKDIPGKYICELTISTIVSERQELITSDPFNYEVKRSILSNVSEIIETADTTVEKLLNDLEATKSRLFNDLELAKTNLHNDLESAKTELSSRIEEKTSIDDNNRSKINTYSSDKIEIIKTNVEQNIDNVSLQIKDRMDEISKGLLVDTSNKIKSASIYLPVTDVSTEEQFINILNKCKDSNCNTITICPIFWMTSATSNTFDGYKPPLTESIVIERIIKAKELGFKVALKPHVGGEGISNHSGIRPPSTTTWLTNYSNIYLELLNKCKYYVDIVCVGNELNEQTNQLKSQWSSLISEIRSIKGDLMIGHACHFDELKTNVFLDELDFIGCNMYAPVAGDLSTNIEVQRKSIMNISNAINKLFKKADELSKPIIITEVGILPFEESLSKPEAWGFDPSPVINEDTQVRYYKIALKEYLNANNIIGTFIWNAADGYTFIDRKAQEIVKQIYGGGVSV